MNSNSKLPREYENPIDNHIIDFANYLSTFFKTLNFTPNGITTLSLFTGLCSVYNYTKNNYIIAAILYLISYFFDCMDGVYARKYKMVTQFGDLYDHFKDWSIILLFGIMIYKKDNIIHNFKITGIIVLLLGLIGTFFHFRYQEIYYHSIVLNDKKEYSIMNVLFEDLLKDKNYHNMKYTRYFGSGTWNIIFISFLIMHKYYSI